MRQLFALLLGLAVAGNAWALEPYMWGVGPRVGTMFVPGRFPLKFPKDIQDSTTTTLSRVRFDIEGGVEAVYYLSPFTRMSLIGGIGYGQRYLDGHVLVLYDYVVSSGAMDFMFGAGVGFGSARFRGTDLNEVLKMPYYPFRADVKALIRDKTRGYQGTLYFQYDLPSRFYYTNTDGLSQDVKGGLALTLGLELSVLFGDFTPPPPRMPAPPPPPAE
jgi:hypothetical protein